jgi:hypothetical protein
VRRAAWLLGAAVILPVAAIGAAQASPAASAFAPTPAPLLLTRTLRHVLHDGKAVVSRRSYRVRFVADQGGFRIDGALADVVVDAPPGLEALAQLERRRPDTGLFPMRLDASGAIVPGPDAPPSAEQRQALELAAWQIARMGLAASETGQAQAFVERLQAQPHRTVWPRDLFHPAPGARREARSIPLANGLRGEVTTEIEASADPTTGLLGAFRRKVTTELDGNTRVVIEEWTLADAP